MPWPKGVPTWNKGLTKEIDHRVAHSQETKDLVKLKNTERVWDGHTEDFKKKQRNNAIKRGLGGVRPSKRIKYGDKTLGSTYELEVVKSLDENKIRWDTCKKFYYKDPNNKKRSYTPDIYLIDYDIYLDPKNDFLINNINPSLGYSDKDKIRLVEEQNNIRVIIVNKYELNWDSIKLLL